MTRTPSPGGRDLDALRLQLYDRPLHPELFDLYKDIRIHKRAWDAQLWVTGYCHVVGFFDRNEHVLVELVGQPPSPLPKRGRRLDVPFRGEKTHQQRTLGGIAYMTAFQIESMRPRVYRQSHDELLRHGEKRGVILVPLPQWTTGTLTPFTYISYDARPDELHVLTFHAFPEKNTLVKTQSLFELG